jgi:hypothetical protein
MGYIAYSDGNIIEYRGEFYEDKYNGKGKIEYLNGVVYEGDFVNGFKEGIGTMIYTENIRYTGGFAKDLK